MNTPYCGGVTLNKNKNKKDKPKFNVKSVIANRGFYITLLTLIMVVGTVAVVRKFTANVSTNSSSFDDEAWESAISEADVDLGETPDINEEISISEEVPVFSDDFPEITDGETVAASKELSEEEIISDLNMEMPCKGKISRDYSPDKLIYSKTTDDWRTHNGIDISAKDGAVVCAAADGVVEAAYEDDRLGIVVVVGHEGNIKTLYANLQDINFIEVGRKVAKGDAVGAIGNSSILEKKDEAHLHFEVMHGKESKNPSEYIPL